MRLHTKAGARMAGAFVIGLGIGMGTAAGVAPASAAPPPDRGWITGTVDNSTDARRVPCAREVSSTVADAVGAWHAWNTVVCFPKRSSRWYVDQIDSCTVKSDVTTGFRMWGNCVFAIDMGSYVKLWAPRGSVDEDFRLVWL